MRTLLTLIWLSLFSLVLPAHAALLSPVVVWTS